MWQLPAKNIADWVTRRAYVRHAAHPVEVPDDLVTTADAAELLGCYEAFVVRRIYVGSLPAVRLPSGQFLVPEAAVWDLMVPPRIKTPEGSSSESRAAHRGS